MLSRRIWSGYATSETQSPYQLLQLFVLLSTRTKKNFKRINEQPNNRNKQILPFVFGIIWANIVETFREMSWFNILAVFSSIVIRNRSVSVFTRWPYKICTSRSRRFLISVDSWRRSSYCVAFETRSCAVRFACNERASDDFCQRFIWIILVSLIASGARFECLFTIHYSLLLLHITFEYSFKLHWTL